MNKEDYTIEESVLVEMGINLKENEMIAFLERINNELNDRVGTELLEELSIEKIDEYNVFAQTADPMQIGQWLYDEIPEFNEIIQDEIDIMLGDIAEDVEGINIRRGAKSRNSKVAKFFDNLAGHLESSKRHRLERNKNGKSNN